MNGNEIKLIPAAESYANKIYGESAGIEDREKWNKAWNSCFLNEMDKLARKAGLIK